MFIRKSAGRSGATKVQLAERRDGRNVILEHVGTARTEAELAELMAKARRRPPPWAGTLWTFRCLNTPRTAALV